MSVPMQWVLAFAAVMLADVFWGLYVRRIAQGRALAGAVYAVLLFVTGAAAVISYTTNWILIVPAAAGAFAGTWLSVHLDKSTT